MNYLQQIVSNEQFRPKLIFVQPTNNNISAGESLQEDCRKLSVFITKQTAIPSSRVGILVSSKLVRLQCIGALVLSRNVYVPLDDQAPDTRNIDIILQNKLHGLLVAKELYDVLKEKLPKHQRTKFDSLYFILFHEIEDLKTPDDLAFILNTSGSTGTPKGVMITHENAKTFIEWASKTIAVSAEDVIASIAPFHFDLSVFDIYIALKHGASLVLFEPQHTKNPRLLAQQIAQQKVTIIYATPTLLRLLLHHGKLERYDFSALRYVLFAGEVFPVEDLKQLKRIWQQAEFFNWYGPTETNVCTSFKLPDDFENQQKPFPIGKACIPDTIRVAPDGELLVSGTTVTPGYINNPQRNQNVFSIDKNGKRWYHTGDLVRVDENEDYIFVGRKDRMVKRRGYRIELDEIEYWLRKLPVIQQCAVIFSKNVQGEKVLACFYTLSGEGQAQLVKDKIRTHLSAHLPIYMLPDFFKKMEELPKTSSQKVDYVSLKGLLKFNNKIHSNK